MSGTGRDAGGMNAGTSGSSAMGDRGLGSAEVHTGLHSGGTDQYSGLQFAGHEQDTGNSRLRGVADAVRDRIPEGVRNLGAKAGGATSGVRERLSGVNDRTTGMLESRGLLDRLRDNPLPVLGVAFALGFLLSGRDDDDDFEPTRASRARSELRSALMAGVTAGIAQGARGFLGEASTEGGSFLNTLLDNLVGGKGGAQTGGSRSGGPSRAGGTGGSSYGSGGGSRAGTTGGSTAGRSGSYSGGSTGRPPSHQEY
ncbi:hypothetical protein [Longimicrobium sp.]|uniref:hypothetical protein n=1 Tax=Longimicrobium sp. TaxID=2029185 RepID=UPI002E36DEA2|nr:hypothetical protein [Longimicrobium sp.]HEX6042644.1 hypothetical protein [Longimicrobium sp.]